jgi:hypothetical protein
LFHASFKTPLPPYAKFIPFFSSALFSAKFLFSYCTGEFIPRNEAAGNVLKYPQKKRK